MSYDSACEATHPGLLPRLVCELPVGHKTAHTAKGCSWAQPQGTFRVLLLRSTGSWAITNAASGKIVEENFATWTLANKRRLELTS